MANCADDQSARNERSFGLRYILASPMYGTLPLGELLPEAMKIGADAIDIWPRVHADHREQMEALGHEAFAELLAKHSVALGMLTRYDLGPERIGEELPVLAKLGGKVAVTGARPDRGEGDLRANVRRFVESLDRVRGQAEELGVRIGIENHSGQLLASPDGVRWFAEFARAPALGVALAPYHLPQDPEALATLIRDLGDKLVHFQAWQHGMGCTVKLPKEQELLQMPGRGPLDFAPAIAALAAIDYRGWTEIFMHPVPRGAPILPSPAEVTAEINRARRYLDECAARAPSTMR